MLEHFTSALATTLGVFAGLSIATIALASIKSKKKTTLTANDLLEAFEQYKDVAEEEQRFEELETIDGIIFSLQNGVIPIVAIEKYNIKVSNALEMQTTDFGSIFRLTKEVRIFPKHKV